MLNRILDNEVQILSNQQDKIRAEGFQIQQATISEECFNTTYNSSMLTNSSVGDDEPFLSPQKEDDVSGGYPNCGLCF